jgi:hypothetical protein
MSKVEVDQVDPQSGTTLTLGTSGDTVSIPSGVTLANAGTATGFASIAWQSSIVTAATHTAAAGQGLWLDTSSNAITLTLPASPSVGDQVIFTDYARNWGTNAVTLTLNGSKYQGNTSPAPVYDTSGQSVDIVYSGATQGWIPNSDDVVSLETPQSVDVQYLVVAGGAAGGGYYAGGGGAGGLLTSTLSGLAIGVTLTATVGAGGAAVSFGGAGVRGNNGVNSTLAGSGFTTVTCIGGGGGGADNSGTGNSGGSGGGGSQQGSSAGGSGTSGQGNNGGSSTASAPDYGSAGGGGAGAVGGNANNVAGDGGVGLSNSITGSAVFYAGGGGGSSEETATGGAGGNGGGGASGDGGSPGQASTPGTANTGGGGGGANQTQASGAGGSGVVILRVLTDVYSGTSTGSPTVTTDGSHTVIKFTGNGTYTT